MYRYLFVLMAGFLLPLLGSAQCLTTLAPNPPFVPPIQYPPGAPASGTFWYGTDELWTALSVDGKWKMEDTIKLVFWGRRFDWRKEFEPKLIVTGNGSMATRHQLPSPTRTRFLCQVTGRG
jgi:hypothetical protein